MKDTRKILGKYISNFIWIGIIIGAIAFIGEMILIDNFAMTYPALVITLIILIFTLTTFLIHMIVAKRTIGKAVLTEEKKKTLTKTLRVIIGVIALIVMFVDYFAFSNINKSFINTYRTTEVEQLKALVVSGEKTQEEIDNTQKITEANINTIIYICMGTKEITNIIVYLAVAVYLESKILKLKTDTETEEVVEKEEVKE